MKRVLLALALAASALAPAAVVAGKASAAAPADKPKETRACFQSDNIMGWRSVNDDTVNIETAPHEIFQLKLMGTCDDIDTAERIGLRTSTGAAFVCDALDLQLIVPSSIGPHTCPITSLRKLTPAEVAALPKKQQP